MKKSALSTSSGLALALEPRMMFDGAAVATAAEVASQAEPVALAASNPDAPGVTATGNDPTVTIDEHGAAGDVDLFKNVSVSLDNKQEELSTLVITVDTYGEGHALVVDGTKIALVTKKDATEKGNYTYSVEVTGGKTNITIFLDNGDNSIAAVNQLIDGISYKVVDGSKVKGGPINVTLTSLSDSGKDTAELDISSTISVNSSFNIAPELDNKGELTLSDTIYGTDLGNAVDVAYSSNGKYAYAADSSGHISVFSVGSGGQLTEIRSPTGVNDLGSVGSLALNEARSTLYAITKVVTDGYTASGGDKLIILDILPDGTLKYKETINLRDSAYEIYVSHDGKQVYQNSRYNGMHVYNVDDTGLLTYSGMSFGEGGVGRQTTVTTSGEYLFATGSGSMWVYSRNLATGELSLVSQLSTGVSGVAAAMRASADGSKVFVAYGDKIVTYAFSSGQLTKLGETSATGITDMEISSDGNRVYISTSSGSVQIYTVDASGALSLSAQAAGLEGANALSLGSDGSILVGGKSIALLVAHKTAVYGEEISFAGGVTLSDANFDVLNNGLGNYGGAKITIEREGGAKGADTFTFVKGSDYSLDGSTIKDAAGTTLATVANTGGKLTITFADGVTKEQANAILHQWRYVNNTVDVGGTAVNLKIVANDGKLDSNPIMVALRLGVNTAPEFSTQPVKDVTYTGYGVDFNLFSNTTVNAGEAGQGISELHLTVSGLSSVKSNEYIKVDGTAIALNASSDGKTTNGYAYKYTLVGNIGTLVITPSGSMSTSAAAALINGIAYNSANAESIGSRSFTIDSIKDNGGTDNGGKDSAAPGVSASIIVDVNTSAPSLESGGSGDSTIFYNGGTLNGFSGRVNEIDISADSKTVIICADDSNYGNGNTSLYVYSRDLATGALKFVQKFVQGLSDNPDTETIEANGLNKISSAVISNDGKLVYVAGFAADGSASKYSITLFERNTDTGLLVYKGIVATQGASSGTGTVEGLDSPVTDLVLSADGRTLYTLAGVPMTHVPASGKNDIAIFTISDDGRLAYTGKVTASKPSAMTISSDGKYAYVANATGNSIYAYSRDVSTGALTLRDTINQAYIEAEKASGDGAAWVASALSSLRDMVITPDGSFVYVCSGDKGLVSIFSRDADDGQLHFAGAFKTDSAASVFVNLREIAISEDGSTLYVGGAWGQDPSKVLLCSIDAKTGALTPVDILTMSGPSTVLAVSPDGKNIYSGVFANSDGLCIANAMAVVKYSGSDVFIAGNLTVSDPDFDRKGSYAGMIVSMERNSGANTADVFRFENGNGLTFKDGKIQYNGTAIAAFVSDKGLLKITFEGTVSKEVVNRVLHQVTYSGAEVGKVNTFTVTVSDGEKTSNLGLSLEKDNNAPSMKATPIGGKYDPVKPVDPADPQGVALFDNAVVALGGDSELLKELVVTVDKSGSAHSIIIDGESVTLTDGNSHTTKNGYACTVSEVGGKSTVKITLAGKDATAVKALIDSMRYSRSTDNLVRETVTATLVSLSDAGDKTTRNISSVVTIIANSTPIVNKDKLINATIDKGKDYSSSGLAGLFTDLEGDSLTWDVLVKLPGGHEFVSLAEAGLSFDPKTFTISGRPTESGTFTIQVKATDAYADKPETATHSITLEVRNLPPVFKDDTSLPPLPKGAESSIDLNKLVDNPADGDTLTWALKDGTSLPVGLIFNANGTISGKSTTSGTYTFEVTVTDSDTNNPGSATKTITLTVENSAPQDTGLAYTPPQAIEGVPYTATLPADMFKDINGDTLEWSVSGLPDGLSFNSATRTISGTPAEVSATANVTITITVTDPENASVGRSLTLTVRDNTAPVPSDVPLAPAREGAPYTLRLNDAFTDKEGDALTYSVTSLPKGLAFDAGTGTITGRPEVTGSNSITVTATDAYGKSVSHTFELIVEVNGPPVASEVSFTPPQATEGENYSLTLPENLFTDPDGDKLSLSVSGLPEGLGFDPATGRISGTPSGSGTFTIVITATDPSLAAASRSVTLVVEAAPITVLPPVNENTTIPVMAEYSVDGGGSLSPGSGMTAATEPSGIFDEEWQSSAVMSDVAHVWATVDAMWSEDARRQGYGDTRVRESRADTHADASDAQRTVPGQVNSNWGYDVAGNRYMAALPQTAHRAINGEISGYTLAYADSGKDASGEFRFDASAWALVSPGFKAPGHVRLLLVVTTVDGKTVRIPVEVKSQTHALNVPATPAVSGTVDREPAGAPVEASSATGGRGMAEPGATALSQAGLSAAGVGTVESGAPGRTVLFAMPQGDMPSTISENVRFSVEAAGQAGEAVGKPALGNLLRMSLDNSFADKPAASSRDAARAAPEVLSA